MPRRKKTAEELGQENKSLRARIADYEARIARTSPLKVLYTRNGKSAFEQARFRLGQIPIAMRNYSHNDHPGYYKDPFEEYWDLVNRVTMWDVGAAERQVELVGKDAAKLVQMLTTRDMTKCQIGKALGSGVKNDPESVIPCDQEAEMLGQCKYSFLTLPTGGIYNDPVVVPLDANRFWLSLADTDVLPAAHMLRAGLRMAGKEMDVQIREPDVAPLQIQGPFAGQVTRELLGEMPSYTNKKGERKPIRYYWYKKYLKEYGNDLDGLEFVAASTGYSAEVPYEIYVIDASKKYKNTDITNAEKMWEMVWEAGQPYGLSVIGPCHIRRIEAGILALGRDSDMWWDTNPFEVDMGYEWMVDLRNLDNDFIGREALEKVKTEGVPRKLVGVDIDNEDGKKNLGAYIDGSMPEPFLVYKGKRCIGKVTSGCYSPRIAKNIGYAMLDMDYTAIGTEFMVETPLGRLSGMAVQKPHWDPKKEIPKQK